ncbi:hypothetical protein H632_c496p1 [Helicosporidium sp. ATCC 50920]|nr:hypothetical protein H632_c496p1 [Helicosporidium sp. ATCC 50920]|eukprot:KDD75793.1 hypothetical protein H632_c496p1 [Helicosporidium sp. ATCC 50920]
MLSRFFKRESAKADFGSGLPGAPLNSIYGPEGRPAEPSLEPSSTSHNLECVEVNLIAEGKPVRNDGSVTSSVAAEIGSRCASVPNINQPEGQDHICVVRWESLNNPMLSEPRLSWSGITKELKDHARLAKPGIDMPAHGPVSEVPLPRTRTRVVMHRPL